MTPGWMLIATIGVIVLVVALILRRGRDERGLLSGLLRSRERERLEDALKHLSEAERSGAPTTIHGLAGRLGVSGDVAAEILSRLGRMGLVRMSEDGYTLTEEGRSWALQTLRAHRLWERYLADRTGVEPEEWHARAERMEHVLKPEEAEALSSRLGHPRFDPHGDPIPTRHGELPPPRGVPLATLHEGEVGRVTHLEDEPREVYRMLVSEGFAPGRPVEVKERGPDRLRVGIGGRDVVVDGSAAGNVTVEPLAPESVEEALTGAPKPTLADAQPGRTVVVEGLSPNLRGPQRRRLLDLGLVPGTEVTPELVSASGDPVAYRIRGALIALRRSQSEQVEIEPDPAAVASSRRS